MSVVDRLARAIDRLHPGRRVIVAFDGPDAAGKTTLAGRVGAQLGRPALHASVDRWHLPREIRQCRGAESAEGYYRDSFDYAALQERLLEPFLRGALTVTTGHFDALTDLPDEQRERVAPGTALMFDGVFLLRPELRSFWHLTIYVHVSEAVTLARAAARDSALFGGEEATIQRYERRYLPGQALYRADASPRESADILIDNTDPERPAVLRWRAGPSAAEELGNPCG